MEREKTCDRVKAGRMGRGGGGVGAGKQRGRGNRKAVRATLAGEEFK